MESRLLPPIVFLCVLAFVHFVDRHNPLLNRILR